METEREREREQTETEGKQFGKMFRRKISKKKNEERKQFNWLGSTAGTLATLARPNKTVKKICKYLLRKEITNKGKTFNLCFY